VKILWSASLPSHQEIWMIAFMLISVPKKKKKWLVFFVVWRLVFFQDKVHPYSSPADAELAWSSHTQHPGQQVLADGCM